MFFKPKKAEEAPLIEFFCHPNFKGVFPEPKPAAKHVAQWYKDVGPDIHEHPDPVGAPGMSAKKCLPMLDAMTLGYIMPLVAELGVKTNKDCSIIQLKNLGEYPCGEFHSIEQIGGKKAPGYPAKPIKFLNPWIVKTRPGWSTMFMPLVNNFGEYRFTCLGGLVDTDTYVKEVNFPAIWHAKDFDGYLPAGTPLVVAIPIHRSALIGHTKPVIRDMTEEEFQNIERIRKQQQTRRNVYTKELREPRK